MTYSSQVRPLTAGVLFSSTRCNVQLWIDILPFSRFQEYFTSRVRTFRVQPSEGHTFIIRQVISALGYGYSGLALLFTVIQDKLPGWREQRRPGSPPRRGPWRSRPSCWPWTPARRRREPLNVSVCDQLIHREMAMQCHIA